LALLYSSPVRDGDIVLGKFVSGMGFLGIFILLTLYMPGMILVHGKVSFAQIAIGYLGLFLVGGATLAIGLLASSLVRSQLVAAILAACIVITCIVLWWVARVTERPLSDVLGAMALHQHFQPFQRGILHIKDVVYYLLVTFVALFAATRVLEARRWR
jgi:ABC-2 type transport system permease protein